MRPGLSFLERADVPSGVMNPQFLRGMGLAGAMVIFMTAGVFAEATTQPAKTPGVREKAPDFSLKTLDDQTVELAKLTPQGPVVVIMLRGWVGYQCPVC